MFKKKKSKGAISVVTPNIIENKIMKNPKICSFDLDNKTTEQLKLQGYNVESSSLGSLVKINNNEHGKGYYCLPNGIFPENLHEFELLIFDQFNIDEKYYINNEHEKTNIKDNNDKYIFCAYPQNIFDPRPFTSSIIKDQISIIQSKPSIVIIFANKFERIEYNIVTKGKYSTNPVSTINCTNYSFMPNEIPFKDNKLGKEVRIVSKNTTLQSILSKFISEFEYRVVFNHRQVWSDRGHVNKDNFSPLMLNTHDEIIAYAEISEKQLTIVLPNLNDKSSLLNELLNNFLPEIQPEIFPNSSKATWKSEELYLLPNEKQLGENKSLLIEKHNTDIIKIDKKIKKNKDKYSFLHNILTLTGDELVIEIIKYLKWLGFDNIKNMDEESNKKEEDIQIDLPDGSLLVIEAKGIGGTSKDDECAQISKIRSRRCEERDCFDVYALYIVNHQRHLPPLKRKNPPFTNDQISDSELNKRGLITTWQLFNLFFDLQNKILTKEHVMKKFCETGLINFSDDLKEFTTIKEILRNGYIIIFDIKNDKITKNTELYRCGDYRFEKIDIQSLQIDGKDVQLAENCEIGIKTNYKFKVGDKLYLSKNV